MTYISEEAKVGYRFKDRRNEKILYALEWLTARCSHVPNKGEQGGVGLDGSLTKNALASAALGRALQFFKSATLRLRTWRERLWFLPKVKTFKFSLDGEIV
jgi:hypothetical protein